MLLSWCLAVMVGASVPEPITPMAEVIAVHALSVGADLASTEWAMARNPRALEGNPLLRDRGLRLAVKVAEVGLLVALDRGVERRYGRRTARHFRAAVLGAHLLIAAWNIRQGARR